MYYLSPTHQTDGTGREFASCTGRPSRPPDAFPCLTMADVQRALQNMANERSPMGGRWTSAALWRGRKFLGWRDVPKQ